MISQRAMKTKSMKKLYILAAAVLVASCGNGGNKEASETGTLLAGGGNTQATVQNVEVSTAQRREVPQESVYSATVEPYAVNNIAPQTAGRIRKINVDVGSYVGKGQILAEMDRLQLEQTRLQLQNDSTEYVRLKALYEQGGLAASDFEAFELAYRVRQTSYQNLLENTILRSPITGYVTARNYDVNDLYSMAQPIFTVQQIIPVKLLVGISESEYTKVKKGDSVTLTVDALPGREFTGQVVRLHPTMNAATHTFNVEVRVNNNDRALRPGMYARVTVKFGVNNSIVVPDRAIVKQEGSGQRFVYVLNQDNTVSYVPVGIGRHMGREYEITSGLEEGWKVVVKGQNGLKDGSSVNVLKED